MIYEYRCSGCAHVYDVVKSYRDRDCLEQCPDCKAKAVRAFAPSRIHIVGAKVTHAEYNPGLGCIVKNKRHKEELCRQMGVQEIGNEKTEKIHKHYDQVRADKHKRGWAEADKGWVGNGT